MDADPPLRGAKLHADLHGMALLHQNVTASARAGQGCPFPPSLSSKSLRGLLSPFRIHQQTPAHALEPLLLYLPRKALIWEPSCGKGNLVRGLKRAGWPVIGTDLLTGHDALTYAPAVFGYIVGNPPFSIKDAFLARCYQLGRPFALLMPAPVYDSEVGRDLLRCHNHQLLLPSGRIHFETPNHAARAEQGLKSSAWFYSVWVTWQLGLPEQVTFV